jgi:hypothetical protein
MDLGKKGLVYRFTGEEQQSCGNSENRGAKIRCHDAERPNMAPRFQRCA